MFGGDSTKASNEDHHQSRGHSDAVIDPALRSLPSSPSSDKKNDSSSVNHPSSDHPSSMPHRVEQFQMSSPFVSDALCSDTRLFNVSTFDRRRHHFDTNASHRLPSPPPPITTMSTHSHSPSPSVVSVDRSSNSTPHIRRSPPQHSMPMYAAPYQHDPPMMPSARHHSNHQYAPRAEVISHPGGTYLYSPHPAFDQHPRYDHHQHHNPKTPARSPTRPPLQHMNDYNRQYPIPNQPPVTIVHTDDAATKLTDGIRRRCFNCCTTDTSTWRRSNLSPGKVLCNKCGLFERTHSRPRPDQFPHKRGPLAVSALRGRTPPGQGASNQLPPISGPSPYQYHHQPITPLNAGEYHSNTLPGLQAWHGNTSASSSNSSGGNGHPNGSNGTSSGGSNTTVTGPGVGGGENSSNINNGSNGSTSGSGTQSRRPTLVDSPRLQQSSQSSSPRGRTFDEQALSSNAADPSSNSHSAPHSHPPSPPSAMSRLSTVNNTTSGGGGSVQESSSASHTPPPPAGAAREPPA
ncbi:hypothetical protein CPB84DRAFT_1850940 [Gymnopilus junonius]|uniref:GATA-type domain-containing protein n=1 Tax=Gymnopilus junonius TaxID=109634 RepID=A0A9P5NG63_GYMJU|nr:hypothetical protein CPB84DRAFT_1850940 [Gymnopilus junonius]